jgi:hypothetical protein
MSKDVANLAKKMTQSQRVKNATRIDGIATGTEFTYDGNIPKPANRTLYEKNDDTLVLSRSFGQNMHMVKLTPVGEFPDRDNNCFMAVRCAGIVALKGVTTRYIVCTVDGDVLTVIRVLNVKPTDADYARTRNRARDRVRKRTERTERVESSDSSGSSDNSYSDEQHVVPKKRQGARVPPPQVPQVPLPQVEPPQVELPQVEPPQVPQVPLLQVQVPQVPQVQSKNQFLEQIANLAIERAKAIVFAAISENESVMRKQLESIITARTLILRNDVDSMFTETQELIKKLE